MSHHRSPRNFSIAILLAIGATPIFSQISSANESSFVSLPPQAASFAIAQKPNSEREEQLERQREAERVLKEAERLKREVREESGDPSLQRRVDEEVNRARESDGSRRTIRRSERELDRLREQKDRSRYEYNRFRYPYQPGSTTIFVVPAGGGEYQVSPDGTSTETFREDYGYDRVTPKREPIEVFGTVGFKNNNASPGIGVRYNNIGLELGAVFNQDSLNGIVNDVRLPIENPTFGSFTDLGIKKVSPQWGVDVLGFVDVAPTVSLYGSVGIYFQSLSQIVQSQATREFYKQTNETNTTGALGGGVKFKPSDNVSIGVGYHSIRGVTAGVGFSF
jgi:opacity protein-like surface antigen